MPLLIQLANLAAKIIDTVGSIGGAISRWTTSDADKSKAQLTEQIADVDRLTGMMKTLDESGGMMRTGGILQVQANNLKGLLGLPEDADLQRVDQLKEKLKGLYDQQRIVVTPSGGGSTKLPATGGGDANDPVDRAINSLQKHIETQKADTLAVGLGDAALAGFRASAAETAAVMANGGKETAEQASKFALLRQNVIDATDAFARAKVANDVAFGRKTAFLSQEDVQIATQLKGIYPDVATALGSVEAAGLRTNNAMKGLAAALETNLTSGLTDIAMGTKTVSAGFKDMGLAIVKALDEMLIKMLIVQPIMRSISSLFGGFGGSSGPITLGTSAGPTPFASAHGNMFDGGNVIPFANGGIVGGPTLAPMALMGEAGPEAIVPLKRGADGNLGIASSGGGGGGGVSFGDINIQVPQGTTPETAGAVGASVKAAMIQVIDDRLSYHARPRGMLNRAA